MEAEDEGSKFRSIKIDKTTADTHAAAFDSAEGVAEAVKVVAFEQQAEEEQDISADMGRERVKAEKGLQVAMAGKMEAESVAAAAVGSVSRKRKRTGLTVRWAEDDKLQSYKYFLKEEPIVKREKKRHADDGAADGSRGGAGRPGQSMQESKPLTASLDWYCPARFTLPPLLQAQQQDRGRLSSEKQTQREREKTTLRAVYMPGQETMQQPVDGGDKLEPSDVGVAIIPFELPRQAPAAPSPAETKTSGADLSNQTAELLSKLTSLASLINAPSSSSSAAIPPSASSPYQSHPMYPAAGGNGGPASALSSLFSSLSALPSSVPPIPAVSMSSLPAPPAASIAPSGGTSKLLSLLSNSSALSGLAAALQQAPTPPAVSLQPAQPPYAAPSHAAAYPPAATGYAPPSAHPPAASSGYYASTQPGYPALPQVSIHS